jgi:peptidoglycan/LPS O-acetylase OafA/YrhL
MAGIAGFGSVVMTATWSLAIEEQFYLTAPVVVRKLHKRQLARILVAVILAAPLLRAMLCFEFLHGGFASYVLMPCRADDLCLGIAVAMVLREEEMWQWVVNHHRVLYAPAMILAASLVYLSWRHYGPYSAVMVTAGYTVIGLFYTCCLLIVLTSAGPVRKALCNKRLMQLGTLAYCTYLFHLPIIEFCDRLLQRGFSGAGSTIDVAAGMLGIAITLVVAALSWKYFERPLLRRGHAYKY